jgi:tRNA-2-methylthio-N6-dimethylallyladenosine synthase
MKRAYIKSYGCQMNVHDSQRMADVLAPLGYGAASGPDDADLVILNTCHIRENASEKVFSELGRLKRLKAKRDMVVAVAGCVAQAEGDEIVRRAPVVDLVFGPQTYHRLPQLLDKHAETEAPVIETEFPAEDKFANLAAPRSHGVTAFLTVQEGCDKFCSFCVVPYTRGAEFSRPVAQIEAEARKLAAGGVREVTLLGQNVNAFRGSGPDGETWSLARLIGRLSMIEGLERIRFTTSHPRDMSDDLIEALGGNPKLMPYLHLPIQAGSDRILKTMNRGHAAQHYLDLIARIRRARPDVAISGDFIVGFPGETETDFAETLAVVRKVEYASAFSFKYSPRPGTPAAERDNQIAEDEKADRLARLQSLLERQRQAFNAGCLGRTLPILIEKPGRHPGQMAGRSPYLQAVHLSAPCHIGDIVEAEIAGLSSNSLSALIRRAA